MSYEMTEHEEALFDMLFSASHGGSEAVVDLQVEALLRTVRATALRDAAKEMIRENKGDTAYVDRDVQDPANWLFDRADDIESGKA